LAMGKTDFAEKQSEDKVSGAAREDRTRDTKGEALARCGFGRWGTINREEVMKKPGSKEKGSKRGERFCLHPNV